MRIVAGRHRGRVLVGPTSSVIRPTSDRLREAIFNVLMHSHADAVTGARVLDLFAGTGAMGLEALSRGAAFALFIDDGAEARALIRANVDRLGAAGVSRVFRRDATRLGPAKPLAPFSLVFCDPPYGQALAERALAGARDGDWLAPAALVVVEEAREAAFAWPDGFSEIARREHGDSQVRLARFKSRAGATG